MNIGRVSGAITGSTSNVSSTASRFGSAQARRSAGALALALLLASCSDMGSQEQTGTGLGVVLGGLTGALVGGSGNGRIIGAAVGATVGGVIGNRIGAALDDNDRKAIAAQSQQALTSAPDDTAQPWKSDHTDATASMTATNTRVETRNIAVVRDANVAPATALEPIGKTYQAKTASNIRLAPTTNSDIVGKLGAGDRITAVGKVKDQDWIMVARHGRSIGYVSAGNLEPATVTAAKSAPAGFDLDSDAPVRSAADLDALAPGTQVDQVTATVPCRDVKTTVSAKGQSETSTQSACKSPDGTWELL